MKSYGRNDSKKINLGRKRLDNKKNAEIETGSCFIEGLKIYPKRFTKQRAACRNYASALCAITSSIYLYFWTLNSSKTFGKERQFNV